MDDKPSSALNRRSSFNNEEPDKDLNHLARAVIGAAIEVHRHLGPGLTRTSLRAGFQLELSLRGIPFQIASLFHCNLQGTPLGKRRMDLIVDERLIVELKSVEKLAPIHSAQLIWYLRLTGINWTIDQF